jgi:hypothetical protein
MDNLAKGNTNNIGLPMDSTPGVNSDSFTSDWNRDRGWWMANYANRPYVSADRLFEDYEPGYQFGYESANKYRGRKWNDIEPNLRTDWETYEGRGHHTWEHMKDAAHDAWDKVTGKR